jgi:hypothetical protein
MSFAAIALPALASTALRLGLLSDLAEALEEHVPTPWSEVVGLYASADFVGAADILATIASRPEEAEARLHAADQLAAGRCVAEADEQLQQARDFFRSVGATHYLRKHESLPADAAVAEE